MTSLMFHELEILNISKTAGLEHNVAGLCYRWAVFWLAHTSKLKTAYP